MKNPVIKKLTCIRCGAQWFPRQPAGEKLPISCPKCRTKLWNKPRVYKKKKR